MRPVAFRKRLTIDNEERCPCCSGKTYEECCKLYINSSFDEYRNALEQYEFIKAYRIAIARLANYLMNVKAHTIPLLKGKNPMGKILLDIDIKAIEGLMDEIFGAISQRRVDDNLEDRFLALSDMIPEVDEWKNLFQFYAILYCDFFEKEKRHQIINEIDINENTDKKLLEIVFANMDYNSGIGKKLNIINLIIKKSGSMFEILQYKFATAIEYYVVNDIESSTEIADKVIKKLEECQNNVEGIFEINKMAEIYAIYAGLFDKETYYQNALDLYAVCESLDELNEKGYSEIYKSMAYIYLKQHLYSKSMEFFKKSYEFDKNNFSLIYMVENLLYLEKYEEAKTYIDMIENRDTRSRYCRLLYRKGRICYLLRRCR